MATAEAGIPAEFRVRSGADELTPSYIGKSPLCTNSLS
jgi:hypothetical protein